MQRRAVALSALSELNALPKRQREALVATALRGSTRADVARTMGLSEGAVRQLVHRARHAVRTAVTALTPYPLAQLFAGSGSGAASDASLAAGAASAGGVAVKLGALLASGVVATGIATTVQGSQQLASSGHATRERARARGQPPQRLGIAARIGGDRSGFAVTAPVMARTSPAPGTRDLAGRPRGPREARTAPAARADPTAAREPAARLTAVGTAHVAGREDSAGGSGASRGGGPGPERRALERRRASRRRAQASVASTVVMDRRADRAAVRDRADHRSRATVGQASRADRGPRAARARQATAQDRPAAARGRRAAAGIDGGSSGSTEAVARLHRRAGRSRPMAHPAGPGTAAPRAAPAISAGGAAPRAATADRSRSAVAASASDGGPQPSARAATRQLTAAAATDTDG